MTQHRQVEAQALAWFVRLSDVEASEADWRAFGDWIAVSPVHRAAYEALEQVWIDLDEAAAVEPVAKVTPLRRAANADARVSRRRVWLYPIVGVAAAAALTAGLWPQFMDRPLTYQTQDAPRTITLEDGSTIKLNRHSSLKVRFKDGRRQVSLKDGEAAFDVAHDATRPFTIDADGREVRVVGTAFNIVSHNDEFTIGVERGVVSVQARSAKTPLRLIAGQTLHQSAAQKAELGAKDVDAMSSWSNGVLVYRDASITDVSRDLSRYFNKPFTVSASARGLRFTGALRIADETTMLAQLRDFSPVTVERTLNAVHLSARAS
nr:FecR domain-containing protein [uncultured Brevundimonas sp.]